MWTNFRYMYYVVLHMLIRTSKMLGCYNISLTGFEYEVIVLITQSDIPI